MLNLNCEMILKNIKICTAFWKLGSDQFWAYKITLLIGYLPTSLFTVLYQPYGYNIDYEFMIHII